MGQQNAPDEVMLQRADESATRLLQHLSQHAAGRQGEGTADAAMAASGKLESAIMSLRRLVVELHKESQRR